MHAKNHGFLIVSILLLLLLPPFISAVRQIRDWLALWKTKMQERRARKQAEPVKKETKRKRPPRVQHDSEDEEDDYDDDMEDFLVRELLCVCIYIYVSVRVRVRVCVSDESW